MSEESATKIAKAAKAAFEASQLVDASERVKALQLIKSELEALRDEIHEANKLDLEVQYTYPPIILSQSCASLTFFPTYIYLFCDNRLHSGKSKPAGCPRP